MSATDTLAKERAIKIEAQEYDAYKEWKRRQPVPGEPTSNTRGNLNNLYGCIMAVTTSAVNECEDPIKLIPLAKTVSEAFAKACHDEAEARNSKPGDVMHWSDVRGEMRAAFQEAIRQLDAADAKADAPNVVPFGVVDTADKPA